MYCGKPNHQVANCPKKTRPIPSSSLGSIIAVDLLEAREDCPKVCPIFTAEDTPNTSSVVYPMNTIQEVTGPKDANCLKVGLDL
ncbi:hypothetical protein MUCCIDRAFT_110942 [Mucor lusitanicus CBS 277.49]|uniref:CCHC-type zinc finger transcription factor n=1 Tax=Mucor lusitanicus CBS 277.49 TaxID=747725 RepID=A0A168LWZ0_MUCCL|nr:hypothetical protein MUCCIDRAFT_110942 [Mucor lusitanicus CBS 277.49]